jgi:hypothetical protein
MLLLSIEVIWNLELLINQLHIFENLKATFVVISNVQPMPL